MSGVRRRWGAGAAIVLVIVALVVTVLIGLLRSAGQAPQSVAAPTVTPSSVEVYVHVAGAVDRPGLYRLHSGARVVDAIAAAGGFVAGADPSGVNLARAVSDGEQLHVPREGESPAAAAPGGDSLVDLNTADAAALEALPRIGPALAERIIAWREENGHFTSVDDLLAVPGIGEKLLDGLRDGVRV